MNYAGAVLPRDAVAPVKPTIDFTNNPSLITIGNGDNSITLPSDVVVSLEGDKIIAEDQILDGVSVFTHMARKPFEITFDFVLRDTDSRGRQVFPQDKLDELINNVWLPNSVQKVVNTFLNKIGIQEVILKPISPATVRGSTNIPVSMKCYENVPGESIIIS